MDTDIAQLLTAGSIAKEVGISDAKTKKFIKELGVEPAAKKGVCYYYSRDTVKKIKAALK